MKAESWQILSPVHAYPYGVDALNRMVQTTFREATKRQARERYHRIPEPMGPQQILYGDKVINTVNRRRNQVWPRDEHALRYVANGEIGIVVGQYKGRDARYRGLPWKLEVEFSSQPGYAYDYGGEDFPEESQPLLELAYGLTVHKTQGSEFAVTFVIVPEPCWILSRELLYTAFTRQRERLLVLHQGEISDILRYSGDYYSEAAARLTNLFTPPALVRLDDRLLEEELVHKTQRGESVKSKSEVIIANMFFSKGIDYSYEKVLRGEDGSERRPDFTIEDAESGLTIYWEHLGMLNDPVYRQRWERKLSWYRRNHILPFEGGGGPRGTLVVTRDHFASGDAKKQGMIDAQEIERVIEQVFGA